MRRDIFSTCKKRRNTPPRFMKAIKSKRFYYAQKILLNPAYQLWTSFKNILQEGIKKPLTIAKGF